MRCLGPSIAVAVVAVATFAALDAHAAPPAPAKPGPAEPPPAPPSAAPPKFGPEPFVCIPGDDVACSSDRHRVCAADGKSWGPCVRGPVAVPQKRALDITQKDGPPVAHWETLSTGLMAGGVVLCSLGGVALIVGAILTPLSGSGKDIPGNIPGGLIAGGVVGLVTGIPMAVVGSLSWPTMNPEKTGEASVARRFAGVSIAPYAGARGVGLHGTF
jgi:hypothetical protein